jgi:glycosyltransferase involved in cell wall biosynthesis
VSLDTVERIRVRPRTPLVVYVHESPYLLRQVRDFGAVTRVLRRADLILAVSPAVRAMLEEVIKPLGRIATVSGFVPARSDTAGSSDLPPSAAAAVRNGARIVGGVGTMSWYKGTDLFVAVARRIRQLLPQQPLVFIWVGEEKAPDVRRQLEHDIRLSGLEGLVILPGRATDPTPFFKSLSLFLLPSREDSWPLVMLEAATAGVPTVCFQKSGGAEHFFANGGGTAVPYLDVEAMAQAAIRYLSDADLWARDSHAAQEIARLVTAEEQVGKIAREIADLLAPRSSR